MVVLLKTVLLLAMRTRRQLSAFQDYFLANSEKKKTQGETGHIVGVTKGLL